MTVTALGASTTWAEAASVAHAITPTSGGRLVAFGYVANDGGTTSAGTVTSTGGWGTAPTWSTPITVHVGSAVGIGLVMAYSTNAFVGNGSVTIGATGANLCGCRVAEITGVTTTFADDAVSAAPGHAITLSPVGDLIIAGFYVESTTDHVWTNAAELWDANDTPFAVTRASAAYDETSPANPSTTPTTGDRVMAGFSFTTAAAATLDQSAFRWYADDADPTTATALAAEDTDITARAVATATILRAQIQAVNDPASIAPRLEWRIDGQSNWTPVA